MSLSSKVTLGLAVCVSGGIIGYVHYKQSDDRFKLHQGVLRDVEQQQRRKHENRYALQQQIDMTKQLKAVRAMENETESPIAANVLHMDTNEAPSNADADRPAAGKLS